MTMTESRPDARAVDSAIAAADFQEGISRGRWRIVDLSWPLLTVTVQAALRNDVAAEVALRIDVAGYPQVAPTSMPWDLDAGCLLSPAKRPRGEYIGWIFRTDWEAGRALYAPFDRTAIAGHPSWPSQHPADMWSPDRTLGWLLGRLHQALNDDDYEGCG